MMQSVEQLIRATRDPRLQRLPVHARNLIGDLATRLDMEHRYAKSVKEQAEKEVDAARALMAEGPEGSDTFLILPASLLSTTDDEERPLGKGVGIEFRQPEDGPGEGIGVTFENGKLEISGVNALAVVPVHSTAVSIEKR